MHHVIISPEEAAEPNVRIRGPKAHHLRDVLRLGAGDTVRLTDGAGRYAAARVLHLSRSEVIFERAEWLRSPPPPIEITLMQAVPKPPRMDWIVEKSVELGVAMIRPVLTERTVIRSPEGRGERQAARWRRIALAAAEQCGTVWLTDVAKPASFDEVLNSFSGALLLIASLEPQARPLHHVLSAYSSAPKSIGLLIGPEGDFSPAETAAAIGRGARPISLGPRVLRVDTAALCALSVIACAWPQTASSFAAQELPESR